MTPVVGVLIREGGRPVSASEVCSSSFLRLSTTYGCPGSRGVRDPGECDASHWETCRLDGLKLWHAPLVYSDRTFLLIGIRAKAAPAPKLRRFHETTLHRVPMDVTQLLDPLVRCTNVEVMVPGLPNALPGAPG